MWVIDRETCTVIGWVRRHTVTPGERAAWATARPLAGEWVAQLTYTAAPLATYQSQVTAAEALWSLWDLDPDPHAPEVPAP